MMLLCNDVLCFAQNDVRYAHFRYGQVSRFCFAVRQDAISRTLNSAH